MENKKIPADKINSTYWWVIKLDRNHHSNYNSKVLELTGYSKMQGHDEAKDKGEMFMKKIVMLFSHGYIEKAIEIIFYSRRGELLNKSNSRKLLSLRKNDYKIYDEVISDKEFHQKFFIKMGIQNFLTRFYDCIANGKDVKYLLPNSRASYSKDELMDVTKHDFTTNKQLYAYCERLIKNGHPYEAVMSFQRKYEHIKGLS